MAIDELSQNLAPLEGARNDAVTQVDPDDADWLTIARDAYTSGRDWFDTSIRMQTEKALAHFRNQHAPGSKYHTDLYIKKSRTFRPKTRALVRRTEAAVAVAFFSTQDLVHVSPVNESKPEQRDSAEVHNCLLNYRLENTIPWFMTLIAAAQDAAVTGVVISHQYWHYEDEREDVVNVFEEQDGTQTYEMGERRITKNDKPCVGMVPLENLILDPAANWTDPINTSPYVIEMVPMYVWELDQQARAINPRTGKPVYRYMERKFVAAAIHQDWDSIRKMREGSERIDKYDNTQHVNQYQMVWVRKTIVRVDGRDWCFDTLGAEMMLSDPEPLADKYPHLEGKERPYVMGVMQIEAHKMYPQSPAMIVDGLQEEINDVANLRLDNVKLALNARAFVRRGAGVDLLTLLRNVPGSAVLMSDPDRDVKETRPQDVTRSSYEEHDRLNLEFDELSGNFSAASIGSNRRLNETVGGMSMLSSDASQVKEYEVRTFAETWVEGVMRQLVQMSAWYETDEVVLDVVASRANLPLERVMQVIKEPVNTRVEVGFSATNPQARVGRVLFALDSLSKAAPQLMQGLDTAELAKEVFGALGFRDGARFFPALAGDEDPRIAQLQQQVQQLTQMLESKAQEKQIDAQSRENVANINAQARLQAQSLSIGLNTRLGQLKAMIENQRLQLEQVDRQLAIESLDVKRRELYMSREALSHEIQDSNRRFMMELQQAVPQSPDQVEIKKSQRADGGTASSIKGPAGVIARDQYGLVPQQDEAPKGGP